MKLLPTQLADVLLIEPAIFSDSRGLFYESYSATRYRAAGLPAFVQDNISVSKRGVLRGLHLQHPHAQGKLVEVLFGEVFDVAVDVRVGSPTFARWVGVVLSAESKRQLYVPPGFAHGFLVISETATFGYKCSDYYHPEDERTIRWDDPTIGIDWPTRNVIVSAKDAAGSLLRDLVPPNLPAYPTT